MSRSEARPWSHPQRTIWWTDDKLNPEEHYTIQPGNLNHIRSVPGFQEFKPRAWKIFVLMPGWSPTPSSYWTDSVKDSLLPRLLSWKKIQVCVVLCFTSETFEALRSLSPLPPFPPFTASRASFLLLKQNCEFCECSSYVLHTPESAILKCFGCLIFALPPVQCPQVLQCCCYCW